ncbi:hypothetical protein GCM10010331_80120 [Streptomyces xanthochromogenes]|nr:hypothetical protein GCM10010331_80120 [Streptomyces xanthochromogenes]
MSERTSGRRYDRSRDVAAHTAAGHRSRGPEKGTVVRGFETGQTVVRRDVHRSGRAWSGLALRVVDDTGETLVTAYTPAVADPMARLVREARADRGSVGVHGGVRDDRGGEVAAHTGCGRRRDCCSGSHL